MEAFKSKSVSSKPGTTARLFRALLPSWNFFDRVGRTTRIEYRSEQDKTDSWSPLFPELRRRWTSLFINGEGNIRYACHSLIDRFLEDLKTHEGSAEDFTRSVSHRMVERMVRGELSPAINYQFKISVAPSQAPTDFEDVFISSVLMPNESPYES